MKAGYHRAPGSAWRLALLKSHVGGDGLKLLVDGAYDGSVAALAVSGADSAGAAGAPDVHALPVGVVRQVQDRAVGKPAAAAEPVFRTDVGGFPFAVTTDGFSDNGAGRIYAATAAGELVALDAGGAVVFRHPSPRPLYAVAVGSFDAGRLIACGGIHPELTFLHPDGSVAFTHSVRYFVHRIAIGDFDGNGTDELFFLDGREEAVFARVTATGVREIRRGPIVLPEEYANWENPGNTYKPFAAVAADIDGDGADEIVLGDSFNNRQTVLVLAGDGTVRWVSPPLDLK
jgi:hypothetical protein